MAKPRGRQAGPNTESTMSGPAARPDPILGPRNPPTVRFGREHLRQVMGLSAGVDLDRLCEDAAVEIERLRPAPRIPPRTL